MRAQRRRVLRRRRRDSSIAANVVDAPRVTAFHICRRGLTMRTDAGMGAELACAIAPVVGGPGRPACPFRPSMTSRGAERRETRKPCGLPERLAQPPETPCEASPLRFAGAKRRLASLRRRRFLVRGAALPTGRLRSCALVRRHDLRRAFARLHRPADWPLKAGAP